jgi:hypothetical protein
MSKASDFLGQIKPNKTNTLQELATKMKAAGDSRLSDEMAKGAGKGINERGLLVLAMALKDNGDERLWKELDLDSRVKESADLKATIESLKAKPAAAKPSTSMAGKFLSKTK